MSRREQIIEALAMVVNRHSIENDSNTPDFIVAEYLYDCLEAYNETIKRRNKWYNNTAENHVINPMEP